MISESSNTPQNGPSAEQWRSLRLLLHSLTISVLILTGTMFVYLYRQVVAIRKSTNEMVNFINQYHRSETAIAIDRVQRALDNYRSKNPEFNPIYVKYFGTNSPPDTLSSKIASTNEPPGASR